jgi:hypothetical protein
LSGMKKEFEQHRISETFGRETEDSFGWKTWTRLR